MEKGVCSWCTKSGIISYEPLKADFRDANMNMCIENINASILANKLIKIAKDIFACKECMSAYGLKPVE